MTESFLNLVPADRPVALMLRHAERPELPTGSVGEELRLTDKGVVSSFQLGQMLAGRVLSISSSPVLRCRETAVRIVEGTSCTLPVTNSSMLGDPGVFVTNGEKAFENWKRLGNMGVIRHLATSDDVLPGMRHAKEATQLMVEWLLDFLMGPNGLHLFITHDAVLAPFAARIVGSYSQEIHYPDFLEGIALWRNEDGSIDYHFKRHS